MLFDYIISNYENGEPIFLAELPGASRDYVRQEMKRLTDEGKLERLYNGVYYRAYTTILGTKGRISVEKYIDKKYLNCEGRVIGYITGLQLINEFGFSTQNPSCYEVCSNEATTKQRKVEIDGKPLIIYQPVVPITSENKSALQFLDLMSNIDRYAEIAGAEKEKKLREFVEYMAVNFEMVKKLLPLYPDRVYRNIYEGGMMGALV